jgi:hypothetical protein
MSKVQNANMDLGDGFAHRICSPLTNNPHACNLCLARNGVIVGRLTKDGGMVVKIPMDRLPLRAYLANENITTA